MESLKAEAWAEAYKRFTKASSRFANFQRAYRERPAAFVADCMTFSGSGPAPYQLEILEELPARKRVAVRGLHGLGKTALASWVVLWAVLTADDCKVPTTASAWRQLSHFLWPELHKWAARLRWDRIGREPFNRNELLTLSLRRGTTCEAFAVASDNADLIEGCHAQTILYVYDEAKAIPDKTWDASEGAFAGTGDAYALAISTPGEPQGRFYQIHARQPGYGDWWTRHVTLKEAVLAGRVSVEWAKQRAKQWGKSSAVFQNRVLGEFASSAGDGVIPLSWVEAANQRWLAWKDSGEQPPLDTVGVDVGRGGDYTILALKAGQVITELRRSSKDTMDTTGRAAALLAQGATGVVDVIGIGAGVVDRLREQGHSVVAFNASSKTAHKDRSGELGFANWRAAAWWIMRELLDPDNGEAVALPPDDKLTGDLTAPHWRVLSTGKIWIEPKEKRDNEPGIRKRLGRSTDDGDAVVMAFAGKVLDEGSGGGTLGVVRVRTR